jgi:hypothetical protein
MHKAEFASGYDKICSVNPQKRSCSAAMPGEVLFVAICQIKLQAHHLKIRCHALWLNARCSQLSDSVDKELLLVKVHLFLLRLDKHLTTCTYCLQKLQVSRSQLRHVLLPHRRSCSVPSLSHRKRSANSARAAHLFALLCTMHKHGRTTPESDVVWGTFFACFLARRSDTWT